MWYRPNCWVVMGIRFRSYSVYGLGYCPTMSWSAIIIVNFVCDIYVHIILLLDYALICTHFGRFLNEFDFWSFCVQQFWACKFTVLLCLLVRRREAKRGEVRRKELKKREEFVYVSLCTDDIFLVILWKLWRSVTTSSFTWRWRRSWYIFALSSEALVWLTTKLLCVACVAVGPIYDRSSLPYQGTVSYWLITAFSDGQLVVCGIIVLYCAN